MDAARIVFTTFGSLGDLHPYLSVGQELERRGHAVSVATLAIHRVRVEAAGLRYLPLRATLVEEPTPELIRRVLHRSSGVKYMVRHLLMAAIRQAYEDTLAAAEDANLLVSHPATYATGLVAEVRGLPWLSTQLAPTGLVSAFDPPFLPGLGWLMAVGAGPGIYRQVLRLARWRTRRWLLPLDELRRDLGLPDRGNPLLGGAQSPDGVLALFSPLLGAPQPDWPARVTVTGFPFFPQSVPRDERLEQWMTAGTPPLVFTLGSSAVMTPGEFFRTSQAAARSLGLRALLLGHVPGRQIDPGGEDLRRSGALVDGEDSVFAAPYASYADVFSRAAAVVHQGGIGTTAEALRAGRPMLVVPFGVDQPDNAARVERLGVARVLRLSQYRTGRVAEMLRALLQPRHAERAEEVGAVVRSEQGAAVAADAIDALLNKQ